MAPVGFGDIATLRYTSGTTGRPKGVVFRHDNLRWMAESLASLPPWKARNRPVSYLSFLPMNHVVEGILGTYSPYYAPARLDIYFLENLRDLRKTLPKVRPVIFFSVPRVYEKAWEAFRQSGLGRLYLAATARVPSGPGGTPAAGGGGLAARPLRSVARRAFLRRTGFDRCSQLIVGSAPSSEDLLGAYRGLGIELHNAYGLTEAPLVTMNRPGSQ